MLIPFIKMQAQGNDFVFLWQPVQSVPWEVMPRLAQSICDRHFGVGADGLVLILEDEETDARMVIYNSDGTRPAMCGSALRCTGWLVAEAQQKDVLTIQTDSGLREVQVDREKGEVEAVIGYPVIKEKELDLSGLKGSLVDVGNLHFVTWWDELESKPHLLFGAKIEKTSGYESGINSMYARRISADEVELLIWENACGATLACGTGASATLKVGIELGLINEEVTIHMPGGSVQACLNPDQGVSIGGAVKEVFEGAFPWKT
ncbi:MAG TPA: diaminopimelate epimerase [Candidatus Cloacimonadota bacterium]|nr:diaminopimelate epimerase [Candidatus Cloacimonadota bacterium]